jgi:uncharacterized protein (TIGR03435 family)
MKHRAQEIRNEWSHRIRAAAAIFALPGFLPLMTMPHLLAQTPADQSSKTLSAAGRAPQPLQKIDAARVRMAFDVASVKPNRSNAPASSGFPMGPGDAYAANGGLFSAANQPLIVYLRFAYKLGQGDLLGLPAWVYNDRFDIEARAQGTPTKDQMRLMMQSLLADRFKVTSHTERRTRPVFQLVLSKAGKTGPQLRAHADDGCAAASTPQTPDPSPPAAPSAPTSTSGLQLPPFPCDSIGVIPASAPGRARLGGRGVTIGRIAGFLKNPYTGLDRPVLDRTGLHGTFDFSLEWSLESDPIQAPDPAQPPASHAEDSGPTFLEGLQEQLGLKLKPATGPVDVLVIDHVEPPSPN